MNAQQQFKQFAQSPVAQQAGRWMPIVAVIALSWVFHRLKPVAQPYVAGIGQKAQSHLAQWWSSARARANALLAVIRKDA